MLPPNVEGDKDDEDWKSKYSHYADTAPPAAADGGGMVSLEETLTVVKDQVWSLGDAALKGVAEVLVGFGISPSILGYTEEELLYDEEEIGSVPTNIRKDEVVSKTSFSRRSEENMSRRRSDEPLPSAESTLEEEAGSQSDGSVHGRSQSIGWQAQNPEEFEGESGGDKKRQVRSYDLKEMWEAALLLCTAQCCLEDIIHLLYEMEMATVMPARWRGL